MCNSFVINNTKFVPVGFNAYWLGLTENYDYPLKVQVDEMFDAAVKLKATVIRAHTLGITSGSHNSLRSPNGTVNNNAWEAIDYAFYKAKQTGIKLICPLIDAYNYFHGNYGDFCSKYGVDKTQFFENTNVINDFKHFVSLWLNHTNSFTKVAIKNAPELFAIELGNELGNIRPDSGSTAIPTQKWLTDISLFIKSIDPNHIVLDGSDECLGSSVSNDFAVNSLDMFSAHYYWQDYNRIDKGSRMSNTVHKPYIIGEYDSNFDNVWFKTIESKTLVKGTLFWSMYPHDNGKSNGIRIPHQDGYTSYYDLADQQKMIKFTNHFRRMRGMPTVEHLTM
ncbi:hypothetical protein EBU95_11950 [bacterium]|nr:hypothetical protein [bacterium]